MTDYTVSTTNSSTIPRHELLVNIHIHTVYSDGTGTHQQIAESALEAGVDVLIVTDHNILVKGLEGYFHNEDKTVMLLVGEEVHDPTNFPQKNHLLVLGLDKEVAPLSYNPQVLINAIRREGGLSILAHPFEQALPSFHEDEIPWLDWDINGFDGIELWNGFSELKTVIKNKLGALFYAFFPQAISHQPDQRTIEKWDELTGRNQRTVAVGGSDAHALTMRMGPIRRTIFPYQFHFSNINTHILVPSPLTGNLKNDRKMVLDALRSGHAFIGNDLPYPTKGFLFSAQGQAGSAIMGDEILMHMGVTLQIVIPQHGLCSLIHNGKEVKSWRDKRFITQIVTEPGVYRVEVKIDHLGKNRGWIYSNPIYIRKAPAKKG